MLRFMPTRQNVFARVSALCCLSWISRLIHTGMRLLILLYRESSLIVVYGRFPATVHRRNRRSARRWCMTCRWLVMLLLLRLLLKRSLIGTWRCILPITK